MIERLDDGSNAELGNGWDNDRPQRCRSNVLCWMLWTIPIVILVLILWPTIEVPSSRPRSPCKNSLKMIGLALHNYHETYGSFPPAVVLGPDGEPWHSWRVLLLPFLDGTPLYRKYRFDEPWNGPFNIKLLSRCPTPYRCWQSPNDPEFGRTSYVAVVGEHTAWPGTSSSSLRTFRDGTSNVALAVEVRDAGIPWLAPDDLSFEEALGLDGMHDRRPSSPHQGGFHILLGDGMARYVSYNVPRDTWRGLLTRDGGEVLGEF